MNNNSVEAAVFLEMELIDIEQQMLLLQMFKTQNKEFLLSVGFNIKHKKCLILNPFLSKQSNKKQVQKMNEKLKRS